MKNGIYFLAFLAFFSACSGTQKKDDKVIESAQDAEMNLSGDSDSDTAHDLKTIHFGYDSFLLNDEVKTILKSNASIIKEKNLRIEIEGHCDERGSTQYNIALGEKRASVVKNYLGDQGVALEKLSIVSFGKEKPVDAGHNEAAWAKNRRANFVLTK